MSWWIWLERGASMPSKKTPGAAFSARFGRFLAARRRGMEIAKSCLISPEARLCAREGLLRLGEGCTVAAGALLQGNVRMGKNCSVQAYSILVGYGGPDQEEGFIRIGDHVRIASHTMMIAGNHRFDRLDCPIAMQGMRLAPIVIEDDVWIGGRVNITAGVRIGRGSVIGAGAVVTKDIPPYSVAVGVPARVIRSRRSPGGAEAE